MMAKTASQTSSRPIPAPLFLQPAAASGGHKGNLACAEIFAARFRTSTPTQGSGAGAAQLAGGNIRNIAVSAAFLAADAGGPVRMHHLLAAARVEYAKQERELTATQIGGWIMSTARLTASAPKSLLGIPSGRAPNHFLQRKCACGGSLGLSDECDSCRSQRLLPSRMRAAPPVPEIPPIVRDVLRSTGQPLDFETRSFMEPRFGHDFSRVRLHTDVQAAASARAVDALAYTVGRDIVFGAGQYSPRTEGGRRLLAHELTHVRQQSFGGITNSPIRVSDPQDTAEREADEAHIFSSPALEAEADRTSAAAESGFQIPSPSLTVSLGLMRQAANPPPRAPTTSPQDQVNLARGEAFSRCQKAYERLAGIGPPPPPGRPDPTQEWQLQARRLARVLFQWDNPNMDQITEIVGSMRGWLTSGLLTSIASANDPQCGNRAGYVQGHRPPVVLCPAFFSGSGEERVRTMVHEAAHLARIGQPEGESYCGLFDCETSCGGFDAADSWAHFVNCLSGQPADSAVVP